MKNKIIDSIGKIDDDMIENIDALRQNQKKRSTKKTTWVKWGAIAACLCLVVAGAVIPAIKSGNQIPPVEEELPPVFDEGPAGLGVITPEKVEIIELNGAEYFICRNDSKDILQKYGISNEVTEDAAGDHVCYLDISGDHFIPAEKADASEGNDIELFEYAPEPNENVYILCCAGEYYAAVRMSN